MNTPKIRFKGFTDDWEQRKFSDCYKMSSGYAFKMSDYCDEGVGLINGESIQHGIINDDNLNHLPEFFIQQYPEFLLKENDIVVGLNRPITNGNLKIARIPSKYNDSLLYQRAGKIVYKTDCDKDFTYVLLSQEILKHTLVEAVGSDQPFISTSKLDGWKMMMPSNMEEQVKIGEYFQNLDHLITLHQRKCDETKQLKKFMLQKMFPKNGEKNPEIRFEGFTDDWEQRKLGDVFEQTTNFVDPNKKEIELWSLTVEDGLTPKSERYNREFLVKKDTGFKEVRSGDIVYNPMNMTLGAVGYNGMSKSVAVSGYYTTMITNEGYDSYYINTWLKSPQAMALYKTFATGSLIEKQRVQFPTLSIIPATFPQYEEQVRIGYYFMRLDHLITLHQRKCEKLKELKKYMLQNMFV